MSSKPQGVHSTELPSTLPSPEPCSLDGLNLTEPTLSEQCSHTTPWEYHKAALMHYLDDAFQQYQTRYSELETRCNIIQMERDKFEEYFQKWRKYGFDMDKKTKGLDRELKEKDKELALAMVDVESARKDTDQARAEIERLKREVGTGTLQAKMAYERGLEFMDALANTFVTMKDTENGMQRSINDFTYHRNRLAASMKELEKGKNRLSATFQQLAAEAERSAEAINDLPPDRPLADRHTMYGPDKLGGTANEKDRAPRSHSSNHKSTSSKKRKTATDLLDDSWSSR